MCLNRSMNEMISNSNVIPFIFHHYLIVTVKFCVIITVLFSAAQCHSPMHREG